MNGESGTVICAWPKGAVMPKIPVTYANEVFCGMEYQAASHMIQEDMAEEGFRLIEAVRERFDGSRRNPFNEFECGSNYARSLASYALIPSVSGYTCDLYKKVLRFAPKVCRDHFTGFFSNALGWGLYRQNTEGYSIEVLYGEQRIRAVYLADFQKQQVKAAKNGEALRAKKREEGIFFETEVILKAGDVLFLT